MKVSNLSSCSSMYKFGSGDLSLCCPAALLSSSVNEGVTWGNIVESVKSREFEGVSWEECYCEPQLPPRGEVCLATQTPPSYGRVEAGSSQDLLFSIYLCCEISVCGSVCLCKLLWVHKSVFVSAQSIYVFMQASVQACICLVCWCCLVPVPCFFSGGLGTQGMATACCWF